MPTVPAIAAVCAAFKLPPTPAQRLAFMTVTFSAVMPLSGPLMIWKRSSEKVPAATTKPEPMSMPSVPETLRSVEPLSARLKLGLPAPSIVSADQLSGVGDVPPVAVFTFTLRFET